MQFEDPLFDEAEKEIIWGIMKLNKNVCLANPTYGLQIVYRQ